LLADEPSHEEDSMNRRTLLLLAVTGGVVETSDLRAQVFLERNRPAAPTFAPGQVIVKMRTAAALSAARLGALALDTAVRRISGDAYVYRIPPAVIGQLAAAQQRDRTLAAVEALRQNPDVEYAQPNYRLYIVGDRLPAPVVPDVVPNDTRWADQWHYHNNGTAAGESPGGISLPRAWDRGTGGAGVVVSIIDTGILPGHEDITGSSNLVSGYDMISDPFIANDGDGRDSNPTDPGDAVNAGECGSGDPPVNLPSSWHGTHVAGTAGVVSTNNNRGVAGINHRVSVQAVRVLGKCGGLTSDITDAIRWAAGLSVAGVPNNATPAKVINMSLGTPPGLPCSLAPAMQAAINDAVAAGAVVVVAAGNDAVDASQVVPASCNNVITVAASDARGHLVTRYSNFGATIEIMAPGGDRNRDDNGDGKPDGVLSTVQGGYEFYNGTSMAAPHVAGVAALWLSQDASLTTGQLLNELQTRALPRTATQCPQPCGAGLLSAVRIPGPPPLAVTLALNPDKEKYRSNESVAVAASVTQGGAPQGGRAVAFATDNSAIASVSPASASTDASGQANTTMTTGSRGETTLRATVNGTTVSRTVRVPSLSTWAVILLIVAMSLAVLFRRRPRVTRE
jgi:serine protease